MKLARGGNKAQIVWRTMRFLLSPSLFFSVANGAAWGTIHGLLFMTLISLSFGTSAWGQSKFSEMQWNESLVAAKKEGKVVVVGDPDPVMRNEIIPKFKASYGISIEFVAGSPRQTAARVSMERKSGQFTVDVFMPGGTMAPDVLYPEKMIDPLRPLLVLPEVVDSSKWKHGKLWFNDPEDKFILRVFSYVRNMVFINSDHVKVDEIRSLKDLLNPKWRGKITTEDPRSGSGWSAGQAVIIYHQLGDEFFKRLYLDQKPVFARERRQIADWLARGTYPICLSCREDDVGLLRKEGFKLTAIYKLSDLRSPLSAAPWNLTVANNAPHPNAAKIFVNWILTKEPLEIYSRSYGAATLRNDIEESFLNPETIPNPRVSYFDDYDWNWAVSGRKEIRNQVGKILK